MALRELNLGTSANSGDGDNLRAAATKIKENFAEIYADDYVTSARIADDVALGGNPTTTTQSAGDNSTKIATTAYADNAVATAIDAAPAALDTLNELAASLGDDANFAATMTTSLAGKLSTDAGAVGTTNLADDAVTADKLADSINTEIAANTAKVTNATHTGDVTGSTALTIATSAVTNAKINTSAVTSGKIASSAVTNGKIADDSVSYEKIDDEFTTSDALTAAATVDVDFDAAQVFTLTPTSATTLNITNPKVGITKAIIVTGAGSSYTLAFTVGGASGTFNLIAGEYDDTSSTKNFIQILCVSSTEFWYSISQIAS